MVVRFDKIAALHMLQYHELVLRDTELSHAAPDAEERGGELYISIARKSVEFATHMQYLYESPFDFPVVFTLRVKEHDQHMEEAIRMRLAGYSYPWQHGRANYVTQPLYYRWVGGYGQQ